MQNNEPSDESWLTNHEEDFTQSVEADHEVAIRRLDKEKEQSIKKIWTYFEDSAQFITQLYKDRQYGGNDAIASCWIPFQNAAGNVTKLYKESCDGMKRCNDLANQVGYQRRNKEIAEWARSKRRRYIRREDLLSYLAGKPLPPPPPPATQAQNFHFHSSGCSQSGHHSLHCTNNSHHHVINNNSSRLHQLRLSPKPETQNTPQLGLQQSPVSSHQQETADLHTFKEALAFRSRATDLYAFVAGEMALHCKRPASPHDVNMDSPTLSSKRPRYAYE